MKTAWIAMTAAVAACWCLPGAAQEDQKEAGGEPRFPDVLKEVSDLEEGEAARPRTEEGGTEPAALTEEQKEQARRNMRETAEIYGDVLEYDPRGRARATRKNLAFIEKRLETARKRSADIQKQLSQLDETFLRYGSKIKKMDLPQQLKEEKLRRLHRETRTQRDFLKNRLEILKKEVGRLTARREALKMDYELYVGVLPEDYDENPWKVLDRKRTRQAEEELQRTEKKMKEKRAARYRDDL